MNYDQPTVVHVFCQSGHMGPTDFSTFSSLA
jgi:hypothetical protein